MLTAQRLTKRYGALTAVDNLDLEVSPGELFGFLGPNGAGKTTTIKMLVGLLRPTSGSAVVAGRDLLREPEAAKARIGYVPDEARVYERLAAREFLEFSGDLYHVPRASRDRRIDALLQLFELKDRADDFLSNYSRGMRQKISLAAALLHDPQVLFLDEPTVGLDPRSARQMKDILIDFTREGKTVFLSTHILEIAERMCTRVGIINRGQLVAAGTLTELRAMVRADGQSLEQIFLQLTGGGEEDVRALLNELEK
ncbi:MAG TPA: ABC transporter ATP-binding protein [Candidatus Limnocylindrales bacterium]|nr:ABC transporter ATP-binding protein [Candidatus Limnocylindrales bacterium]